MTAKLIGYWRTNPCNPMDDVTDPKVRRLLSPEMWQDESLKATMKYPDPHKLVGPKFWEVRGDKDKVVEYLKAGVPCNYYRGPSFCRICGEGVGCRESTDGEWVWPVGLDHYVEKHDVRLPEEFLKNVKDWNYKILPHQASSMVEVDEFFWVTWAKGNKL